MWYLLEPEIASNHRRTPEAMAKLNPTKWHCKERNKGRWERGPNRWTTEREKSAVGLLSKRLVPRDRQHV
eukprot:395063-Rhodomonas_salina.2